MDYQSKFVIEVAYLPGTQTEVWRARCAICGEVSVGGWIATTLNFMSRHWSLEPHSWIITDADPKLF
jgi:hypothetical protein